MDPYELYMKEREDWLNEISKRNDRIKKLEEALLFYSDKSNLEKYIHTIEHYSADPDCFGEYNGTEITLMDGVTKVAENALKKEDWRD